MDKFIIDGSHFGGVLQAVSYMLTSSELYANRFKQGRNVELVCDEEAEKYILQDTTTAEVLAVIPY